jgi:general secretion pathway protein K
MLVAQRNRAGFLTQEDIGALSLSLPPGVGFTSNHYWVRTTVRIGNTPQTLTSLVARATKNGQPEVVTLGRWRGAAAPDQVPPI